MCHFYMLSMSIVSRSPSDEVALHLYCKCGENVTRLMLGAADYDDVCSYA